MVTQLGVTQLKKTRFVGGNGEWGGGGVAGGRAVQFSVWNAFK